MEWQFVQPQGMRDTNFSYYLIEITPETALTRLHATYIGFESAATYLEKKTTDYFKVFKFNYNVYDDFLSSDSNR
jgi:hypothetical protein